MREMHHNRITELALKSFENRITPEEFAELDAHIASSKENARYFMECLITYMAISEYHEAAGCKVSCFSENPLNQDLWQMLSEAEVSAPAIKFEKAQPQRQLVKKVVYEKVPTRVNKFSVITAVSCAAALLFLLLMIRFADLGDGPQVATLMDSIDSKWANNAISKGDRLMVGRDPLFLQKGVVKLRFDNNAKIVIEAPAEFQILAEDRIGLNYGKIYAVIPHEAIGFSIYTSNAKVIDLGTEFGINVDSRGDTYLHTIKGQTRLITGSKSDPVNQDVRQGSAKWISADSQTVTDIPCDTTIFAREVDSKSGMVWKGQMMNLVDVIIGGNGFGTGVQEMKIDPTSGDILDEQAGRRSAKNEYHLIPSNSFIDGIFVPNGQTNQVISSKGHLFKECPVTSGLCCENMNFAVRAETEITAKENASNVPSPHLLMHANMGVTFDLAAIRRLMPEVQITAFRSECGIRRWVPRAESSNADFWVLVDGQLRLKKEKVKAGEIHSVYIALSEKDQFLTLVETQGNDPERRTMEDSVLTAIDSDWGMFANPTLVLE